MATENVTVAVFKAANNWPLYAALGIRALEPSKVKVVHISSSRQQMKGLLDGEFDIIHTAADNVVAAHVEPGLGVPVGERPKIFMGGDDGFLTVQSSQHVKSFGDLRGKRVGFDSTSSGFAFVLKKILSMEGLKEGDYSEVVVGGTDLRYKALMDGTIDAATMTPPHDLLCSASGFMKLADASSYLPRYQGVVGACRPGSRSASFLRGYKEGVVKGLRWLRERRNKAQAIEMLRGQLEVGGEARLFSELYDSLLFRERGGFDLLGGVDAASLEVVVKLRREFSRAAESMPSSELLMAV